MPHPRSRSLLALVALLLLGAAPALAENACVDRYYRVDQSQFAPPPGGYRYGGGFNTRTLNVAPGSVAAVPAPVAPLPVSPLPVAPRMEQRAQAAPRLAPPAARVAPPSQLALNAPPPPSGVKKKKSAGHGFVSAPPSDSPVMTEDRDSYPHQKANKPQLTAENSVSTFGADVDTASYTVLARMVREANRIRAEAIRAEELINYFDYGYSTAATMEEGFKPDIAVMPSPWTEGRKLVRIGIKAFEVDSDKRPRANLVFLMDVSGSMSSLDRLPLAKTSLCLLLEQLRPDDTVSLVTYASGSEVVLTPTAISDKTKVLAALDKLSAGGSTSGEQGIQLAYAQAKDGFVKGGVNRVILVTDGDFNVGISNPADLKRFITGKRQSGVYLTVMGFGMGNYQDTTMQALAEAGNGQAAYIGNLADAKRAMTRGVGGALYTVATDTKFQVEFNPSRVAEWRLIGYESRALDRADFNNDRVDAGDVSAGQSVTVVYEIVPAGVKGDIPALRYEKAPVKPGEPSNEYGFLKIRYKLPGKDQSRLIELPITAEQEAATVDAASEKARFAVAVAWLAQILRGDEAVDAKEFDKAVALAKGALGADPAGERIDFVSMMIKARDLR